MRSFLLLTLLTLSFVISPCRASPPPQYGNNAEAGEYAEVNGVRIYYEIYGEGQPLVMIHGNGSSIKDFATLIDEFKVDYQVIVADSRAHGRSDQGTETLSYRLLAEDWNALLEHLGTQDTYLFGYSDGGNIGLLLAINHPDKVARMAIMGANLRNDDTAMHDFAFNAINGSGPYFEEKISSGDTSKDWALIGKRVAMMSNQVEIPLSEVALIQQPVMVMLADEDAIPVEHAVEIYQSLPNAHLVILPGMTHMAGLEDPEFFNVILRRFFDNPFSRPDSKSLFE
jgi:pimeloyl-ACP methyl ester carboxylesterase